MYVHDKQNVKIGYKTYIIIRNTYFTLYRVTRNFFAIFCNNTSIGCVYGKDRSICNYEYKLVSLLTLAHLTNCDGTLSSYPKFHKNGNLSGTLMLRGQSIPRKSHISRKFFT